MPIHTSVDAERRLITHVVSGNLIMAEVQQAFENGLAHPDFRPGMNVVWDFRECSFARLKTDDIRSQADHIRRQTEDRETAYKAAVLVSTDVGYGMSRMFDAYADGMPCQVRVFRDADEAHRWLAEPVD